MNKYHKIKSKIFRKLFHYSEIDLLCYEKIENPNLFIELAKDKRMNSEELVENICCTDNWKCCSRNFWKFSAIVRHIEEKHLGYTFQAELSPKGKIYKYNCDSCQNKFFEYNTAINHYLKKHIIHSIECNLCNRNYKNIQDFTNHLKTRQCKGKNSLIEWSATALKNSDSD